MLEAAEALRYFQALRETLEGVEVCGRSNLSKVLGCMELLDKLIGQCRQAVRPAQSEDKEERKEE